MSHVSIVTRTSACSIYLLKALENRFIIAIFAVVYIYIGVYKEV